MGTDFFDGIVKTFSKTTKEIGKTTKELGARAEQTIETQKIRGKISGEERTIERLKADLGDIIYKRHAEGEGIDGELSVICQEIDQHFQEPLSLESLAITAGVSKYHLAREFKKYLGMPPNEYLIVTRLNHSKTLLKYEDLTIEEIAYSCGFHQVSHYINLFKKHEGCTPLKFRREWHSNEAIKPPDAQ